MTQAVESVLPVFNRCVIFSTTAPSTMATRSRSRALPTGRAARWRSSTTATISPRTRTSRITTRAIASGQARASGAAGRPSSGSRRRSSWTRPDQGRRFEVVRSRIGSCESGKEEVASGLSSTDDSAARARSTALEVEGAAVRPPGRRRDPRARSGDAARLGLVEHGASRRGVRGGVRLIHRCATRDSPSRAAPRRIHLALLGAGCGPGDEVVLPSLNFVAAANAVAHTGARPVFCDIRGAGDLNLDPADVEASIGAVDEGDSRPPLRGVLLRHRHDPRHRATPRTGRDRGCRPCARSVVAEDECAAHSDAAGCFSFFSNKNLPVGEGGMVVTDDDDSLAAGPSAPLARHDDTHVGPPQGHAHSYDVVARGPTTIASTSYGRRSGSSSSRGSRRPTGARATSSRVTGSELHGVDGMTMPFAEHDSRTSAHHLAALVLPRPGCRRRCASICGRAGFRQACTTHRSTRSPSTQGRRADLPVTDDSADRLITLPLYPAHDGRAGRARDRRGARVCHGHTRDALEAAKRLVLSRSLAIRLRQRGLRVLREQRSASAQPPLAALRRRAPAPPGRAGSGDWGSRARACPRHARRGCRYPSPRSRRSGRASTFRRRAASRKTSGAGLPCSTSSDETVASKRRARGPMPRAPRR